MLERTSDIGLGAPRSDEWGPDRTVELRTVAGAVFVDAINGESTGGFVVDGDVIRSFTIPPEH